MESELRTENYRLSWHRIRAGPIHSNVSDSEEGGGETTHRHTELKKKLNSFPQTLNFICISW